MIKLLARFDDPASGNIQIDGHYNRNSNVQTVRRQIGVVMQDNLFFAGTLGENIRFTRPTSRARI